MVPSDCEVTFVQMIQRHGARFPTSKKTAKYAAMMSQIKAGVAASAYTGDYAFLANYTYALGADDLTAFGAQESFNAGAKFYHRYRSLADKVAPFVRSADQERVVFTAKNWTAGFQAAKSASATLPILLLSEADGQNNTIDASTCPAFESSTTGDDAQDAWRDVFVPAIRTRLSSALPGAALTKSQVVYLMDMCPMETVATAAGTVSEFCKLFTEDEWRSYDYYQTLGKYYSDGWGNKLGAAQGVGFVNEFLARLTGSLSYANSDRTTVNHTLDGSSTTFPIGADYRFFADFSHDDPMTSIFSAFGFYNETATLSTSVRAPANETGGFSAAWAVPFAGRAYIEKQTCKPTKGCATNEYIRVIINDRVIPLQNCGADNLGRCKVKSFINSLSLAQSGANWEQCYA